ncbi:MAG: UDP-N-acetylmuramoyl-L-alanine--D-glutamate ligase [Candidatus Ancillula sp.]|nr:UDP-N-acetylmuramoyl-L-alanine--D-glutamate ligase [Candidatus Ancillula sp.]
MIFIEKVVIAGFGVEGRANFAYFKDMFPNGDIKIADENYPNADFKSFSEIPAEYLIIRSPGVAPAKLPSKNKVWTSTNQFLQACPCPVFGVTGSKGKGTTSSLIASILRAAGKKVHLLGNIGVPALSILPEISEDDVVVFEMSSFQLWDAKNSPDVAVLTILEPDHLDVHDSFEEYVNAKKNILKYQSHEDILVYNSDDRLIKRIAEDSVACKFAYPIKGATLFGADFLVRLAASVQLPGEHNFQNAQAAALACKAQFPEIQERDILAGVASFSGLDHRLKLVRKVDGVKYFDDSIATTPSSAVAALKSFDEPKILIIGGKSKGGDYSELADVVSYMYKTGGVRKVVLFGENSAQVRDSVVKVAGAVVAENVLEYVTPATRGNPLLPVLERVKEIACPGDVVLFSPAGASFDYFKNYAERGQSFIDAIGTQEAKILVFDSGEGGRYVANELQKVRPNDELIVVTDPENVPYGAKTADEVYSLTVAKIQEYMTKVDLVVLACNTATALAIDRLRKMYPDTVFVGFEPMIKPASLATSTGKIAVLATPGTLKSARYAMLKSKWAQGFEVYEPNCADWAKLIEKGEWTSKNATELVNLVQKEGIDQVILACTHYLNVQPELEELLGENVRILQPLDAISRRISCLLETR